MRTLCTVLLCLVAGCAASDPLGPCSANDDCQDGLTCVPEVGHCTTICEIGGVPEPVAQARCEEVGGRCLPRAGSSLSYCRPL